MSKRTVRLPIPGAALPIACTIGLLAATVLQAAGGFRPRQALEFSEAPTRTPARHSVDGPLLGNGDMKVALGGTPERQRFHLGKNDLWRLQHGAGNAIPVSLGDLTLDIPELAGADYSVRQPLGLPRTEGEFCRGELVVRQWTTVFAHRNLMWIRLESEGGAAEVRPILTVLAGRDSMSRAIVQNGFLFGQRSFGPEGVDIPSGVAVAAKVTTSRRSTRSMGPTESRRETPRMSRCSHSANAVVGTRIT